jgi:sulfopyruvate decarboxylase TPP-binding subunit
MTTKSAAVAGALDFRLAVARRLDAAATTRAGGARMDVDLVKEPGTKDLLKGASIIAAIKSACVEYVLSVPDIVTSGGLLRPIATDPGFKLIRVCKEDECIGIACGLSYCDRRALALIQHTGFLDSINAIRGVAVEYKQPICMMVGLLQHDPDTTPRNSPRFGVRIVEPILEAMGIPHHFINEEADVLKIGPGIEQAYAGSHPVVFMIGRRPS